MFARCPVRAPRSLKHGLHSSSLKVTARAYSSTTEQGHASPNARESLRSKPTSRNFLSGLSIGLCLAIGWWTYDAYSQRDPFTAYSLVAKEPVSSTASIFHLEPKSKARDLELYKDAWKKGIWNVQFKQPQLQIVRAYTPLPPGDESIGQEKGELRFLIRRDPHGEVSSYLHKLSPGAGIAMRGPYLEYELTPDVRQIVFFAGGTGIAPAVQVAHALFEGNETDVSQKEKKLHILWASRTREDCLGGVSDSPPDTVLPPKPTWSGLFSSTKSRPKQTPPPAQEKGVIVKELEALKRKYPGQVTVEYYVNTEDTWIDEDAVFHALARFDDKVFSTSPAGLQDQRQILISGPPGFITYLAGPKEWRNGREEQGSVSKLVAHALSRHPHNVKVWKI
ncbi:nitrate reductase [Exophiala viscosa]|uniref:Nitrate reductase n=1 Tax=Exophiala viscosa TaxID=2486360 RepID=A0AAN6DVI2_9EURO|nr:nitrate reductase [Exophiala viscosa]